LTAGGRSALTRLASDHRETTGVQAVQGESLRHRIDVFVLVPVRLYREGIAEAVARDGRFRAVGTAASLGEAREQLDRLERAPDAVLIDLGLAERAADVHELRREWPSIHIVALAVRDAEEDIVSWADLGVAGLVSREATLVELLDALEAAVRDEVLVSAATAGTLLRRVAYLARSHRPLDGPALTRREREVVRLIGDGLSNKEIAGSLRIELPTVKNHVHNILEKLNVARRDEAFAAARARGELDRI
jgi:two-component system nitrate/nitrite response regulator NarL